MDRSRPRHGMAGFALCALRPNPSLGLNFFHFGDKRPPLQPHHAA
jgi:hypothetical protein